MSAAHNDPFHHVNDAISFELPSFVLQWLGRDVDHQPTLPQINLFGYDLQLTKFMVLQVVVVVLSLIIFRGLAARIRDGQPARGRFWNFWEALALFVRDEVVRKSISEPHHHHGHDHDEHGHGHEEHGHAEHGGHHAGHAPAELAAIPTGGHYADRFLPFVWSAFFYVLLCNLLGAIPFLGSPTGDTSVTGMLALSALAATVYSGVRQSGAGGFLKSLVPGMDLPAPIAVFLIPMIWVIEAVGLLVKHGVLAIRLFANMMAGHVVIGVFVSFIAATAHTGAWYLVTPASIAGQLAIGALELFVAFLQAYVFSLLASMFIGAAVNPH